MSVLGRTEIIKALKHKSGSKRLFLTPMLHESQIGDASIDVRLGNDFYTTKHGNIGIIDPKTKGSNPERFRIHHWLNRGETFYLHPNELALASTIEYFSLPQNIAAYVTSRSKWGRLGLIIATAAAVHPGFKGTITLELVNHGNVPLALYPGLLVAQIVLFDALGATKYRSDELSHRTNATPSDVRRDWQKDMSFWVSENS